MSKLVVMGVSGCGKSTLGGLIAEALGCPLIEGDDHHLPASRAKMSQGIALGDADREPWLDRLGELVAGSPGSVVLTCSALKRAYRQRLRAAAPGLLFVYAEITEAEAVERVASRPGHFFKPSAVHSQFETLESPVGEPGVVAVPATASPAAQLAATLHWLGLADVPGVPAVAAAADGPAAAAPATTVTATVSPSSPPGALP